MKAKKYENTRLGDNIRTFWAMDGKSDKLPILRDRVDKQNQTVGMKQKKTQIQYRQRHMLTIHSNDFIEALEVEKN